MRVVVPSAGQMSLVVELSDEVRSVSTQQTSATVLVVEAGPIASPLKRQILNAPSGLALLQECPSTRAQRTQRARSAPPRDDEPAGAEQRPGRRTSRLRRFHGDGRTDAARIVAAATTGLRSERDGAKPTLLRRRQSTGRL